MIYSQDNRKEPPAPRAEGQMKENRKPAAEEIRLRHLYRNLVLRGKLRLPFEAAVKLVGPDCAFHLYGAGNVGEPASAGGDKSRTG